MPGLRGLGLCAGLLGLSLGAADLAFSPVYFARPVAVYQPAICLDAGVFGVSLFCRPAYGCYYFGDYYDDRYVTLGIRPWFYFNSPRVGFDPLFGYYRWYHVERMGDPLWGEHLVGWHDYYRGHPEMRPPRTWAAQEGCWPALKVACGPISCSFAWSVMCMSWPACLARC